MALLGNILSLKSVSGLTRGDVGLGSRGFKYRTIVVGAGIEKGKITVHEAALDSAALIAHVTIAEELERLWSCFIASDLGYYF